MKQKIVKKQLKIFGAIVILLSIVYGIVSNLIMNVATSDAKSLNNISLGQTEVEYYTGKRTSDWGFSAINSSFNPDALGLTPEIILKEAASNLGKGYRMGNKGYNDAWKVITNLSQIWQKTPDIQKLQDLINSLKKQIDEEKAEKKITNDTKDENIVVLDADLDSSTKTELFKEKHPERFIEVGIAEADMIGTAAGLATCKKIPFVSTFAYKKSKLSY